MGVARLNPDTRRSPPSSRQANRGGPGHCRAPPDGTVWFTQDAKGNIARIDNTGTIAETKTVKGSEPFGIVAPNGDPWYTMMAANKFGAFQLR